MVRSSSFSLKALRLSIYNPNRRKCDERHAELLSIYATTILPFEKETNVVIAAPCRGIPKNEVLYRPLHQRDSRIFQQESGQKKMAITKLPYFHLFTVLVAISESK